MDNACTNVNIIGSVYITNVNYNYVTLLIYRFKFPPDNFDPNIFPISLSALYPHDYTKKKKEKCPEPKPLSEATSAAANTEPNAGSVATSTQLPEGGGSEPTMADKDFFMALACLAARRSKDPHRQVHNNNACDLL